MLYRCFNVARLAKEIKAKRDALQELYTDLLDQQQDSCSEEVLSMFWPHLLNVFCWKGLFVLVPTLTHMQAKTF